MKVRREKVNINFKVDEKVKLKLKFLASLEDKTLSEYLRDVTNKESKKRV